MTTEEKAKAYDEALERARKMLNKILDNELLGFPDQIRELFPMLKESEDERIRKEINTLYSEIDYCITELLKARTDKDSEAEGKALFKMEGLMVGTLQDLSCIEDYLEKQKEQKDYNKLYEDIAKSEWFKKAYEGKSLGCDDEQKEQKPAEKQDYSGLNDLERAIHRGFLSAGVENVPVKIIKETAQECLAQMKPVEWSEEDEKMRDRILEILNKYGNIPVSGGKVQLRFNKEYMWLRHLYEKFSPQPHWKPSEEQMQYLLTVINDPNNIGAESCYMTIKSLYNDLKKL